MSAEPLCLFQFLTPSLPLPLLAVKRVEVLCSDLQPYITPNPSALLVNLFKVGPTSNSATASTQGGSAYAKPLKHNVGRHKQLQQCASPASTSYEVRC
jgi:hypothetical protein